MKEKIFNDAIIGNRNLIASFSKSGELLRLYYPQVDFKQYIDFMNIGIKVNDSGIIYLHSDINNIYTQEYVENTNILNTYIYNSYFKLEIKQTDFVPVKQNVLVKKYKKLPKILRKIVRERVISKIDRSFLFGCHILFTVLNRSPAYRCWSKRIITIGLSFFTKIPIIIKYNFSDSNFSI